MKINGSSPTTPTSRKSGGGGASGATFEPAAGAAPVRGPAAAGGAMAVSSVDALLALQSEDFHGARRRATKRAFTLLDVLDDIKIALLEGGVPPGKLNALLDALSATRDDTNDARLETVLDEVETRAMVELAKHESRAA